MPVLEDRFVSKGADRELVKQAISRWRLLNPAQKKGIENPQSYQDFTLFLHDLERAEGVTAKTTKEKRVKRYGIDGLVRGKDYLDLDTDDPEIRAYVPLDYDASRLLASRYVGGCEGRWCIAYQKTDKHWINILGMGVVIYVILPETKYAIHYAYPDDYHIYDAEHNRVSPPIINNLAVKLSARFKEIRGAYTFTTEDFLKVFKVDEYTLNPDGTVSVKGDVCLTSKGLENIPVRFKEVGGNFNCSNNKLTSLKNAPEYVGGNFLAHHNQLASLDHAPMYVGGDFNCSHNNIVSLENSPKDVGRHYGCYNNRIESLKGCPDKIVGSFKCHDNSLSSLRYSPETVEGSFECHNNKLTSLDGRLEYVGGDFLCMHNQLTSLVKAPKRVGGNFTCSYNKLVTLEGSPKEIGANFICSNNALSTLEHSPEKVSGDFDCYDNKLLNLDGAPKEVGGNFWCYDNSLVSIESSPKVIGGHFYCSRNNLTSDPLDVLKRNGVNITGRVNSDFN